MFNFEKGNFTLIILFNIFFFSIYLWDNCFFGAWSNASGYHLLTKERFLKKKLLRSSVESLSNHSETFLIYSN